MRRTIAVGGGRGGVGKSVLAANLGVYVAQLGRSVLLIDADPAGAALHTVLGIDLPNTASTSTEDDEEETLIALPTQVPGLQLVPQGYRIGSPVPVRPGRKPRWARQVQKLDIDYVILDLGAGTNPATLDLFLSADIGITVASPEPPSIEATYRFARALFQRVVRRLLTKDRFKSAALGTRGSRARPAATTAGFGARRGALRLRFGRVGGRRAGQATAAAGGEQRSFAWRYRAGSGDVRHGRALSGRELRLRRSHRARRRGVAQRRAPPAALDR
ncbi:MAG: MinD/ParA family protein [Pseudomonadota bacterium]